MKKLLVILSLLVTFSCKDDTVVISEVTPIVFVHGYFGSGDSFEWIAKRFTSNGFPRDRMFAFDWNSVPPGALNDISGLEKFISDVLLRTGASKVHLVGHSMGGGMAFNYCKVPANADNVDRLVVIAPYLPDSSSVPDTSIATLNVWTNTDFVLENEGPVGGAVNIELTDRDHNEIVACDETFSAVYKFLTGNDPSTLTLKAESEPLLAGRAVSLLENIPASGARVEVYRVDPATGFRITSSPDQTFIADANGYWGPMPADPAAYYEFKVYTGKPGDRPLHYYREPFTHSDPFVYLRTYPPNTSLLALVFALVPKNNSQAVSIFFSSTKALWLGRDVLNVNGVSFTNNTFMNKESNTLALFLYDENNNQQTDATAIPFFQALGVINGADCYFQAATQESITYEFNGKFLRTRNWPSADEGISVALFE